jgi:hypothetical protein
MSDDLPSSDDPHAESSGGSADSPMRMPQPQDAADDRIERVDSADNTPSVRREVVASRAPVALDAVLLSYAWLTELTLEQVWHLHYADKGKRMVEYALQELSAAGLVARFDRGAVKTVRETQADRAVVTRRVPGRLSAVWSLTPDGHAQIKGLEVYRSKDSKASIRPKWARCAETGCASTTCCWPIWWWSW